MLKLLFLTQSGPSVNQIALLQRLGPRNSTRKMKGPIRYTIFPTEWGFFGLVGSSSGLCRSCLPARRASEVRARLLMQFPTARLETTYLRPLQESVVAYFAGQRVDFDLGMPIDLEGLTRFQVSVLETCRRVRYGQTVTYRELAGLIATAAAARAVGSALARNPLPLIVPCHRVLRSDGKLGGFSAPGGIGLKARLLRHERQWPRAGRAGH